MMGLTRRNGDAAVTRPQTTGVTRFDPWTEFDRLRSELDRWFHGEFGPSPRWVERLTAISPAVDLYETADEVVLSTHLPGINREDIKVELVGDTIQIAGETRRPIPEKDVTVHQEQTTYGKFDLRYALPVEVKAEQVKATYRDGVLEIHLPKAESARPRSVSVQIEG